MGSWGFHHVVEYEDDVAAALEKVRQRVFADGAYYPANLPPDFQQFAQESYGLTLTIPTVRAATVEELLAELGRSTRSVLDVAAGVSDVPRDRAASPLLPDERDWAFGTPTPTCEQVRDWVTSGAYREVRGWNQAAYVACYQDRRPRHLHFVGLVGDP